MNRHPAERAAARLRRGMSHVDYKRIIDEEYERTPADGNCVVCHQPWDGCTCDGPATAATRIQQIADTATSPQDADSGLGGDEPFCEHGNLLWSETCDECIAAQWAITDQIGTKV